MGHAGRQYSTVLYCIGLAPAAAVWHRHRAALPAASAARWAQRQSGSATHVRLHRERLETWRRRKGCACRSRTTAAARPALIAAQRVRKPMDDIMEGTHIEIRVRCQLFRQPLLRDSCICICFSLHSARRCSRALQH